MKKTHIIIFIFLLIAIIILLSINYKNKIKEQKQLEYEEKYYANIINKFENALDINLKMTYPKVNCESKPNEKIKGSILISSGNLEKDDLLDIDGESYCHIYADTFLTEDCKLDYKTYMKCKNYKTEGFVDWGF